MLKFFLQFFQGIFIGLANAERRPLRSVLQLIHLFRLWLNNIQMRINTTKLIQKKLLMLKFSLQFFK